MISIVIPTYNRRDKLKKCLDSVLRNNGVDFEIIIVDDCSKDGTEEMIRAYGDKRIKYFLLKKRSGAYKARNYGIDRMKGNYFLTWDSDDEMYEGALYSLKNAMDENGADMVLAPADFYNGKISESISRKKTCELTYNSFLQGEVPKNDVFILVKKKLIGKLDRFLGPNIDYGFYLILSKKSKKIIHLDELLGRVYLESDQISETKIRRVFSKKRSIERVPGIKRILSYCGEEMKVYNPKRYASINYGIGLGTALNHNLNNSRFYFREAYKYDKKYQIIYICSQIPFFDHLINFYISVCPFSKKK